MDAPTYRFYGDLAPWWPLISAPEEYAVEAAYFAQLLAGAARPVHEVLELGSGGGNNAAHLKTRFTMTLVDVAPAMLAVSRRLNPECEHLEGDMRRARLGRTFDAVFVHDAIDYMASADDLRAAMTTAYVHCRPGGIAVFVPDATTETFAAVTDHGGHDSPDGRAARYIDWTWDPDPSDTWVRSDFAFLLRERDGSVGVAHETHRFGLFPRARWTALLRDVDFRPELVVEETDDDRTPRDVFVAHRPPESS